MNEKRQLFNAYKTQRQKDEKDEHRLKAKKAKEDLEKFLMKNEDVTSKTKYYRLEERYEHLDVSNFSFTWSMMYLNNVLKTVIEAL